MKTDPSLDNALLNQVMSVAVSAGEIIMPFYTDVRRLKIDTKEDSSPVTEADRAADSILQTQLPLLLDVPVLSEETEIPSYDVRATWAHYWLVDPLDGTREFLAGNGEFTVNIALISHGRPVLGVVYVPVSGVGYGGLVGSGAFRYESGRSLPIKVRTMNSRDESGEMLTLVASRRHGAERVSQLGEALTAHFGKAEVKPVGSSLKHCLVAEGKADLCAHFWPTSEWDTAAGQAVVEAAGGLFVDTGFEPLRYNRKPSLLNPSFYVIADRDFDWKRWLPSRGESLK